MYIYICIHTYTYTYIHTYIYTYTYTCLHIYTYMYEFSCINMYLYTLFSYFHVYVYKTHNFVCTGPRIKSRTSWFVNRHEVCVFACVYIHMTLSHIYTYICKYIYIYTYICVCICIYIFDPLQNCLSLVNV